MDRLAPYANDHKNPNGPGDARPNALKIIRDQGLDGSLEGKVVLITGCTSGIGVQTARAIHVTGADVYFTGRDQTRGQQLVEQLSKDGKPGKVVFLKTEMDCLADIKETISKFEEKSSILNILICNAGVAFMPEGTTKDGFESHFGINHIAHFYIFQKLKKMLLQSATPGFPSRVVMVSSAGHRWSSVNVDDPNFRETPYDTSKAYGASKTANMWMANEIERRYNSRNLHATSVHPGMILTSLGRNLEGGGASMFEAPNIAPRAKSLEQGAATTVWAAVGKEWAHQGGHYLADVQKADLVTPEAVDPGSCYSPHAFDETGAERLWDNSLELVQRIDPVSMGESS